jgi:hypothetical protein
MAVRYDMVQKCHHQNQVDFLLCWIPNNNEMRHYLQFERCQYPAELLRHVCYRDLSTNLLNHLVIPIWIFNRESWYITWISLFPLPSWLYHKSVRAQFPDLVINRSKTMIRPGDSTMWIIFGSVLVIHSLWSMVSDFHRETILLVADQTTIRLGWNSLLLVR